MNPLLFLMIFKPEVFDDFGRSIDAMPKWKQSIFWFFMWGLLAAMCAALPWVIWGCASGVGAFVVACALFYWIHNKDSIASRKKKDEVVIVWNVTGEPQKFKIPKSGSDHHMIYESVGNEWVPKHQVWVFIHSDGIIGIHTIWP